MLFNPLENDTFGGAAMIIAVSQPEVGSVVIEDNMLRVSVPPSFAGDLSFTYTITDESGAEATATVEVLSANVLSPANDRVDAEDGLGVDTFGELADRFSTLFGGLLRVRLTSVQLSSLALAPLVFALFRWRFARREILVSVTNTPRNRTVDSDWNQGLFKLRHDAVVWTFGKTRKLSNGKVATLVELPNGERSWIDSDLIVDTGF